MSYTPKHLSTLFEVSKATLRNWAVEFGDYLSPTAKPGKGKNRFYSVEDVQVLSLVHEMKREGRTFDDIHVSLKSGQRGKAPELPPEQLQIMAGSEQERRLVIQVDQLEKTIGRLNREIETLEAKAAKTDQLSIEVATVKAQLADRDTQIKETKKNLEKATKQVQELSQKLGQEYARGVMEAIERLGNLQNSK